MYEYDYLKHIKTITDTFIGKLQNEPDDIFSNYS